MTNFNGRGRHCQVVCGGLGNGDPRVRLIDEVPRFLQVSRFYECDLFKSGTAKPLVDEEGHDLEVRGVHNPEIGDAQFGYDDQGQQA